MADPRWTDEKLRTYATERVAMPLLEPALAAELLQLREALRAADGLAEHAEHTLTDGERECRMCCAYLPPIALSTPSAAPMPHKPGCPLGKYLAARGER